MRRNVILASLIFMMSAFVSSCIKEYTEPNGGVDISWFVAGRSMGNYEPMMVEIGDYLGFMDTSIGEVTHFWEVGGNGCYMLTGPINSTDSMEIYIDPYAPTITDDAPYATSDQTIAVLFKDEGMKTVRLSNTFEKPVTHQYTKYGSDDAELVYNNEAVYVDGSYLIDTTMYVQVFSSEIIADAKVYSDPELTQEIETGYNEDGSTKTYEILFGESIYFVDNSYYEPNTWAWTCEEAGIGTDEALSGSIVKLTFNALSSMREPFKVSLVASRSASVDGYDSDLPTGTSVSTIIPLGIIVNENVRALNPEFRLRATDRRTVQIILDNTSFDESDFLKSQSGDISVAEAYAALLETVKLNRTSSSGATSTLDCVDIEVGDASDGESANILNLRFGADGEAPLYNSDSSVKLVLSQDIKTSLSTYDYYVEAGIYDVNRYLYDNILPDEIKDLNLLYENICARCGLDDSRDEATVTANNNNILFRAELYKAFFSAYDDDDNETIRFSLVRDPYPDTDISYGVLDYSKDENIDMVLRADIINLTGKLRIGDNYTFDADPALYYYTMKVAADMSSYSLLTSNMIMTAAIVDPYPATHAANDFTDGTSLEYYSATKFKGWAEDMWCDTSNSDFDDIVSVAASQKGYDLSFALVIAYTPAGSTLYFKDLRITNEQ